VHHPKGTVGALFAVAFTIRMLFAPSTAAPAKLRSPQPQRKRCSLKQEQLALDRECLRQTFAPNHRQIQRTKLHFMQQT